MNQPASPQPGPRSAAAATPSSASGDRGAFPRRPVPTTTKAAPQDERGIFFSKELS